MPQPHLRTKSKRRLKVTLPGGRRKTHYKKEPASTSLCALCKRPLKRISSLAPSKFNRSKRKIWRPYGGTVCHECLKKGLKEAARKS